MSTKNGNLNDGRAIFFGDQRVEDISRYPVFSKTLKVIQRYYRLLEEDLDLSFDLDGQRISKLFLTPRSVADLVEKRKIYERIAQESFGMLGRTPDFIDSGVAVLAEYAEALGSGHEGARNYSQNIKDWAGLVRSQDFFVSHAIQNPQIDRSKKLSALLGEDQEFSGVWIKEERADGVLVKGAKQVNTLAPLADQLLVFNLPGLDPKDQRFALSFWSPINAKGIKIVCRKPMMRINSSPRDYPLSGQFDEMDAFIIFDDVFIPNHHLFVCGEVDKSNAFFEKSGLFVHTAHQDEVRGLVKLEFVTALAVRLAEKLGLNQFLRVKESLGSLTVNLEMIRSSVIASEVTGHVERRVYTPNMQMLLAVRAKMPEYYDEALHVIAEFSSGSAVALPSFQMLDHEEIGEILRSSLSSELMGPEERMFLLNLAWDVSSEGFGQRQRVYEFLHGGNPMWIKVQHSAKEDLSLGFTMLDRVLEDAKRSK